MISLFPFLKTKKNQQKFFPQNITYPCMIKSSAGTGKTETIANIIVDLVTNGKASLDEIATITFTNKATLELTDRIQSKLNEKFKSNNNTTIKDNLYNTDTISTIHSFCDKLLREYGLFINISPNFKIYTDKKMELDLITKKIKQKNNTDYQKHISNYKLKNLILKILEENENKGIEHLIYNSKLKDKFWVDFDNFFVNLYNEIYDEIASERLKNNFLTPNDLLKYATKLIDIEDIAILITKKLKYLFIDEFQDTNVQQYLLAEKLSKYLNLLVVGDEKQSIYKFRGSDIESYRKMEDTIKEFGSEHILNTNINYRSDAKYIKKVNEIFSHKFYFNLNNINFTNTKLIPFNKDSIFKTPFELDFNENIDEIINKLSVPRAKQENVCYNDIVILCRNNKDISQVESILSNSKIPYNSTSNNSLFNQQVIIDIIKIIEFLIFKDSLYETELQNTIFCKCFCADRDLRNEFVKEIKKLEPILKNCSPSMFISSIIEKTNFDESQSDSLLFLQKLQVIARQTNNYIDFYNLCYSMMTTNTEEIPIDLKNDAVTISTIHKFKGLSSKYAILYNADYNLLKEYNIQYIISNNTICFDKSILDLSNIHNSDHLFEKLLKKQNIENLEEELKVLYVALTRAKHKMIICCKFDKEKIRWRTANTNYISYMNFINTF